MARLSDKELFLLDMDGTIYLDRDLFPWTIPFLEAVRARGLRYRFLTNNSSKSGEDYIRKLAGMGIQAVREEFVTSVDALADDLCSRPAYRLCYVFGTASLRGQLQAAGIPVTDRREDEVDCLIIGFDTELTFQKLEDACILLNRGVDFIAANPDWVCPTWYGSVPDCGSVCEMVGDRLYTDIAAGYNAGIDTAFVLSGEGTLADLEASPVKPTWIFESLAALHQAWEEELG